MSKTLKYRVVVRPVTLWVPAILNSNDDEVTHGRSCETEREAWVDAVPVLMRGVMRMAAIFGETIEWEGASDE